MSAGVGADVEALCSKCGDVWHVVVAKVGDQIAKVQCKECGAYHRYRSHDKAGPKARAASTPKTRAPRAPVERFEKPAVAADLSRAVRRYSPAENYVVGDRIDHSVFGQGVVEALPEPGKFTVFFAVGRKVLVHARDAAASANLERPKPFDHSNAAGGKRVGES
jgi:hypothetical protein